MNIDPTFRFNNITKESIEKIFDFYNSQGMPMLLSRDEWVGFRVNVLGNIKFTIAELLEKQKFDLNILHTLISVNLMVNFPENLDLIPRMTRVIHKFVIDHLDEVKDMALNEILNNESYMQEIVLLSSLTEDEPIFRQSLDD